MVTEKILVCDDDKDILQVMEIVLSDAEYQVKTCSEETEILKYALEFQPDVILLDVWMSTKDITHVLSQLIKNNFNKDKIILVSALNDLKKISQNHSIKHFLPKPFDIEKLLEVVSKV